MSAILTRTALPVRDHSDYTVYPDSDGKPMGETPIHIRNIRYAVEPLENWFADDPSVYIGANMFLYYAEGKPRRHVSPDLFVVKGVPRATEPQRRSYRTWEENGKGPDFVTEFTSKSTKREDTRTKMEVYRGVLKVREYFLFDPECDYLDPPLQGHRLVNGRYLPIKPVDGRLPSQVLGLLLEAEGELVRFVNPATGLRLPIPPEVQEALAEVHEALEQADADRLRAERRAEAERRRAEEAKRRADGEIARLKRELDALRRRRPDQP